MGGDFCSFTARDETGQWIDFQLWDTCSQERFQGLGVTFYRGSDVVCLCADSLTSLARLGYWKRECLEMGRPVVAPKFLLLLTKADLGVSDELRRAALVFGFPVFEVSAKTGEGCDELKEAIVDHALSDARVERRRQAAEQAADTLREMHRRDKCCFGGAGMPRDVLEHCVILAVLRTAGDKAWDRVKVEKEKLKEQNGILPSFVGWVKWGLGWKA